MSSYLSLFLVPKKNKKEKLRLTAFSRNDNIYQALNENLNISFINNGYTKITSSMLKDVISTLEKELKDYKDRVNRQIKALKELPKLEGESLDNYLDLTTNTEEYLQEQEYTITNLKLIESIIYDIENDCTDFCELLANVD